MAAAGPAGLRSAGLGAAHGEQLEPERLDAIQHAEQGGLGAGARLGDHGAGGWDGVGGSGPERGGPPSRSTGGMVIW